jgi:hypothetical protein
VTMTRTIARDYEAFGIMPGIDIGIFICSCVDEHSMVETVWDKDGIYVVVGPVWVCVIQLTSDIFGRTYE